MERLPAISGLGIDPVTRARRYDYSLTAGAPLYPNSNLYPEKTPLEIDVHEGIEVGVLLTGGQLRHYDDFTLPMQPGDIWLCAAWEPHGWQITAPNSSDVVLIFLPEFLGEETLGDLPWLSLFAAPASQRPRATRPSVRERALAIGHEMLAELQEQERAWESALRLDLLRLLLMLSREWQPPAPLEAQSRPLVANLPRIMPALVLVHSRPARRVTIAEAAQSCGLSRAQFCLIFRNTIGMSFGKFCLQSRLGFVAQMLISTDLSTEAIAEQTGFADGSHLHRTFVRHYGCTPGFYRSRRQRL
ncbi:MAG: helix-turn-helix domain-containing protein [Armatimonadota bacterium]|nr:MAG: helix-turn-helix domain-containing protein [Armatimonadota bacterium]